MKKFRKLSLILAFALVVSLFAGCSPAGETSAPSAPASSAGASSSEAPSSQEEPSGEVTKVLFASSQWEEAGFSDFYKMMSEKFHEQYPQYEIEEVYLPYAQYWDKMIADIAAGEPADLMQQNIPRIPQFIKLGQLQALDDYMTPEVKEAFQKNYLPAQNEWPIVTDDKTYALSMMLTSHQLMYNKKLLDDAGVAVPTTPEEFVDACKKLTKLPNQYGYGFATLSEDAFYNDIMIWCMGLDANVLKDGEFKINTPESAKALTLYKELFDAEVSPLGVPKSTYRQMFAQGQIAFLIDGPWTMSFLKTENAEVAANINVAMVPFPTKNSAIADNILVIPTDAKNKEGAWKYMEMCAGEEAQTQFAEMTNTTPGWNGAVSDKYMTENEWFHAYVEGAPYAIQSSPMNHLDLDTQIRKVVIDQAQAILYNNAPVEETLETIQKEVDELIANE